MQINHPEILWIIGFSLMISPIVLRFTKYKSYSLKQLPKWMLAIGGLGFIILNIFAFLAQGG